jgi:hypothetical protein
MCDESIRDMIHKIGGGASAVASDIQQFAQSYAAAIVCGQILPPAAAHELAMLTLAARSVQQDASQLVRQTKGAIE